MPGHLGLGKLNCGSLIFGNRIVGRLITGQAISGHLNCGCFASASDVLIAAIGAGMSAGVSVVVTEPSKAVFSVLFAPGIVSVIGAENGSERCIASVMVSVVPAGVGSDATAGVALKTVATAASGTVARVASGTTARLALCATAGIASGAAAVIVRRAVTGEDTGRTGGRSLLMASVRPPGRTAGADSEIPTGATSAGTPGKGL